MSTARRGIHITVASMILALTGISALPATAAPRITEYPLPSSSAGPLGITPGPDGNLWFTEGAGDRIGKITTSGAVTEYPLPTAGSSPEGITAGPDGKLWFTEYSGDRIGRITTAGVITEYPLPTPIPGISRPARTGTCGSPSGS